MQSKHGISIEKVSPQVLFALPIVDQLFYDAGAKHGLMLTSLFRMGSFSLHGEGKAFDVRLLSRILAEQAHVSWTEQITPKDRALELQMQLELGPDWDVVLESQQVEPHDWHFHLEFDPPAEDK